MAIKKEFIRKALTILIIAILAASFGAWMHFLKSQKNSPATAETPAIKGDASSLNLKSATLVAETHGIAPFSLTEDNGSQFSNKNFKGDWTFLFFGFTRCPALCPTTMATLNKVYHDLRANPALRNNTQIVFISVDPGHDTLPIINNYVQQFNSKFLGATGSEKQLDVLTKQLGILFTKIPLSNNPNDYTIDHSGNILLINPQGELQAVFSLPHNAANIAHDFTQIANYYD